MSGSRGEANFVWRCKNCKVPPPPVRRGRRVRVSPADAHKERVLGRLVASPPPPHAAPCQRSARTVIKTAPQAYDHMEVPKPKKILEFECRGCEFVDFKPEGNWEAKGIDSNTPFKEIDLDEGDWFDYDEKSGEEVSIKDLKWEIKRC